MRQSEGRHHTVKVEGQLPLVKRRVVGRGLLASKSVPCDRDANKRRGCAQLEREGWSVTITTTIQVRAAAATAMQIKRHGMLTTRHWKRDMLSAFSDHSAVVSSSDLPKESFASSLDGFQTRSEKEEGRAAGVIEETKTKLIAYRMIAWELRGKGRNAVCRFKVGAGWKQQPLGPVFFLSPRISTTN